MGLNKPRAPCEVHKPLLEVIETPKTMTFCHSGENTDMKNEKISDICQKCNCICKVSEKLRKQWCAIGKSMMNTNPASIAKCIKGGSKPKGRGQSGGI